MRRRGTILGTLICGLAMVATLGTAGAAQAATQSQSVQSAPNIACFNSFGLYRYDDVAHDIIGSNGYLYFQGSPGFELCQARVSINNTNVEIYLDGTSDCLALNASTNPPTVYLHSSSACTAGTPPAYLQWKFMPLDQTDPKTGDPVYAIQSQYVPSGDPTQCLYDDIETNPAETGACSSSGSDQFLWFGYVNLS